VRGGTPAIRETIVEKNMPSPNITFVHVPSLAARILAWLLARAAWAGDPLPRRY
jgi:hypothetical protein